MYEIIEKLLGNKYRDSEIALNVTSDLKFIDKYLKKKFSLSKNLIGKVNIERFMSVFAQWIAGCNYFHNFDEKYWILKIEHTQGIYYYRILGFNSLERFLESGKIDFDPDFEPKELDVGIFFKPEINLGELPLNSTDSFILGVATTHLKFMDYLIQSTLTEDGSFWQKKGFEIGILYKESIKLLFSID